MNSSFLTLLVSCVEALAGAGGIVPPILFSKTEKRQNKTKIIKIVACILLIQILLISAFCCNTKHDDPFHCQSSNQSTHPPHFSQCSAMHTVCCTTPLRLVVTHITLSHKEKLPQLKWIFSFKCNLCLNQN